MNFIEDKERVLDSDDDLLQTEIYAETIVEAINNAPDKFNIGLFGEWGSGKSSIIRTAASKLKNSKKRKTRVFVYDAWKYSHDSFRRTFLLELCKFLNVDASSLQLSFYQDTHEELLVETKRKPGTTLLLIVAALAACISLYALGFTTAFFQIFATLLLGVIAIYNGTRDVTKVSVSNQKAFAPEQFQECYQEVLGLAIRGNVLIKTFKWLTGKSSGEKIDRLVVVIDNVDRCEQRVTYELLSDVKTFLSSEEGAVFVVPVDDKAIRAHLAGGLTGSGRAADEFLRKVFNVTIKLKPLSVTDLYSYSESLAHNAGHSLSPTTIDVIAKEYATNPRRIIQVLNNLIVELNIYQGKDQDQGKDQFAEIHQSLIAVVLIIREEWPDLYNYLYLFPDRMLNWMEIPDRFEMGKRFIGRISGLLANIDVNSVETTFRTDFNIEGASESLVRALEDRDRNNVLNLVSENNEQMTRIITSLIAEIEKSQNRGTVQVSGLDAFQKLCFLNSVVSLDKDSLRRVCAVLEMNGLFEVIVPLIKENEEFGKFIESIEQFNISYPLNAVIRGIEVHWKAARDENERLDVQRIDEVWRDLLFLLAQTLKIRKNLESIKRPYSDYLIASQRNLDFQHISEESLPYLVSDKLKNFMLTKASYELLPSFAALKKLNLIDTTQCVKVLEKLGDSLPELSEVDEDDAKDKFHKLAHFLGEVPEKLELTEPSIVTLNMWMQGANIVSGGVSTNLEIPKFFLESEDMRHGYLGFLFTVYRVSAGHTIAPKVIQELAERGGNDRKDAYKLISRLRKARLPLIPLHHYFCNDSVWDQQRVDLIVGLLSERKDSMKWSNTTGHLVKVVTLPTEVRYDNKTNEKAIYA